MVDEIDLKIIERLAVNARATYSEIASEVGLSDVAVMKRIRRLEQEGVIRKYTVIVDPAKLGFSKVSLTGINVAPDKLFDVVEELKKRDYVKQLLVTSGDHSLIALVFARSSEEMIRIHDEISRIDGVLKVYPAIVSDIVKDEARI
ncbi:MAG: AsnC family transcriptional regulator [Thermogladius sp.]|jgi:Lrp/AsnC family transcriptional regulator for asnA, asnC and gidA|nr:AsnC family transcriptional regulator [Thermogladius sp.]